LQIEYVKKVSERYHSSNDIWSTRIYL